MPAPAKPLTTDVIAPWPLIHAGHPVFLWRGRDEETVWIGVDAAHEAKSFTECRAYLRDLEHRHAFPFGPRAFGGIAFDPDALPSGIWSGFAARRITLPRLLMSWRDGSLQAVALGETAVDAAVDMNRILAEVKEPSGGGSPRSVRRRVRRLKIETNETCAEWRRAVQKARAAINRGEIRKIVLARSVVCTADEPFDAPRVLSDLADSAPDCHLFCLADSSKAIFMGASPETLIRLHDNSLETDSLAGTRPRGLTREGDDGLAKDLLLSPKDHDEQEVVAAFLRDQLRPLSTSVVVDTEPSIRKLTSVQHLHTRIRALLRDGVSMDDVLAALHPTPAVCGEPRDRARSMIHETERTPRGLFAGAMGWCDGHHAEFAVAIRSAVIRSNLAYVFAGAGIVADSDPDQEWEETEWKMVPMLTALGVHSP